MKKKISLLMIGVILLVSSGCFPFWWDGHGGGGGHGEHGEHSGGEHGGGGYGGNH